jgi:uncharacterized protein YecA (UPF0149 family)
LSGITKMDNWKPIEEGDPELERLLIMYFNMENRPQTIITKNSVKIEGVEIKRNQLCPCGSGKKHKKCCLNYKG